jgi:hypothetical protein
MSYPFPWRTNGIGAAFWLSRFYTTQLGLDYFDHHYGKEKLLCVL